MMKIDIWPCRYHLACANRLLWAGEAYGMGYCIWWLEPKRRRFINIIGERSVDNLLEAHLMTRGFVSCQVIFCCPGF